MKLALPKGRLLNPSKTWLQEAGVELPDYNAKSRSYRISCSQFPDLQIKVFTEKDIPVQVAIGNYDLGVCGLDWIQELLVKYPSSAVIKVQNLRYGESYLCAAASRISNASCLEDLQEAQEVLRLAGEYPNLAESFALDHRLRRFKIFPLWGGAEAYPPESADIILTLQPSEEELARHNLTVLTTLFQSSAFLIANKNSWESKDMSDLLGRLCPPRDENGVQIADSKQESVVGSLQTISADDFPTDGGSSSLRLALADGHQRQHTINFLNKAGIDTRDYASGTRRPRLGLEGVTAKVIRPQDMPLQVANDNFDLAITGRDWLYDHLSRFPTSPVQELLDLGFGKVRIVTAISRQMGVKTIQDLRAKLGTRDLPTLRIASEYINIADKYAWDNHLSPYLIIPTWGASEAFLPEDADILVDNTETGKTLAEHGLDIIDTLFESTACLIGRTGSSKDREIASVVELMKKGLQ
jgi:ATP phosphoribosyltransferase